MEMKLNHRHIRALRLQRSWSQEKLAEAAGLTARTIQRVEADGSASLQTRLRLAAALSVDPADLDAGNSGTGMDETAAPRSGPPVADGVSLPGGNERNLPVLLLITVIYLAWAPIYFSLSRSTFGAEDYLQLFQVSSLWLAVILALWLTLAGPWLGWLFSHGRRRFFLHLAYLGTPLGLGIVRLWQPDFIMHLVAGSLYVSGLFLLLSCYRPHWRTPALRQAVNLCLLNYFFLWFVQGLLFSFVFVLTYHWQAGGFPEIPAGQGNFGGYLLRVLRDLAPLFPLALVLLAALGSGAGRDRGVSGSVASH